MERKGGPIEVSLHAKDQILPLGIIADKRAIADRALVGGAEHGPLRRRLLIFQSL